MAEVIGGVVVTIDGDYSGLQADLDAATALAQSASGKIADALELEAPNTNLITAAMGDISAQAQKVAQEVSDAFASVSIEMPTGSIVSSSAAADIAKEIASAFENQPISLSIDTTTAGSAAQDVAAEIAQALSSDPIAIDIDTSQASSDLAALAAAAQEDADQISQSLSGIQSPDLSTSGPDTSESISPEVDASAAEAALEQLDSDAAASANELAQDFSSVPIDAPDTSPITDALTSLDDAAQEASDTMSSDFQGAALEAPDTSAIADALSALPDDAQAAADQISSDLSATQVEPPDFGPVEGAFNDLLSQAETAGQQFVADLFANGEVVTAVDAVNQAIATLGQGAGSSELKDYAQQLQDLYDAAQQAVPALEGIEPAISDDGNAAATAAGQLNLFGDSVDIPFAEADGQLNMFADDIEVLAGDSNSAVGAVDGLKDAVDGISGAAGDVTPGLRDLDDEEQQVAQHAHDAEGGLASMAEQLTAVGEALIITEGLKELGSESLEASDNITKAGIALTTITGNGTAAEETIKGLEAIGSSDGLAMPSLLTAATRMTQMLPPGTDVVNLLGHIADGAAVMGTDIETAANKFDMIVNSGNASARTLGTLGINMDSLAAALNAVNPDLDATSDSAAKLFKSLDPGDRIAVLTQALSTLGGTAQQVAEQTFGGQWQSLSNQWEGIMADVGKTLMPVVSDLTSFAGDVLGIVKGLADAFNSLPEPVKDVGAAIAILAGAVIPVTGALAGLGLAVSGLGGLATAAGEGWATLGGFFTETGDAAAVATPEVAALGDAAAVTSAEIAGLGGAEEVAAIGAIGGAASAAVPEIAGLGEAAIGVEAGIGALGLGLGEILIPLGLLAGAIALIAWAPMGDAAESAATNVDDAAQKMWASGDLISQTGDKVVDTVNKINAAVQSVRAIDLPAPSADDAAQWAAINDIAAKTGQTFDQVRTLMMEMATEAGTDLNTVLGITASKTDELSANSQKLLDTQAKLQATYDNAKASLQELNDAFDGDIIKQSDLDAAQQKVDASLKSLLASQGLVQQAINSTDFTKYSQAFKGASDDIQLLIDTEKAAISQHAATIASFSAQGFTSIFQAWQAAIFDAAVSMGKFNDEIPPLVSDVLAIVNPLQTAGQAAKDAAANLQSLLTVNSAPLDAIAKSMQTFGNSTGTAKASLSDMLTALPGIISGFDAGRVSLDQLDTDFGKVSTAISKMAKEDLPGAVAAWQTLINDVSNSDLPNKIQLIAQYTQSMTEDQIKWAEASGTSASAYIANLNAMKQATADAAAGIKNIWGNVFVDFANTWNDAFKDLDTALTDGITGAKSWSDAWQSALQAIEKEIVNGLIGTALGALKSALDGLNPSSGGLGGLSAGIGGASAGLSGLFSNAAASSQALSVQMAASEQTIRDVDDDFESMETDVSDVSTSLSSAGSAFNGLSSSASNMITGMTAAVIAVGAFVTIFTVVSDLLEKQATAQQSADFFANAGLTGQQVTGLSNTLGVNFDTPAVLAALNQIDGTLINGQATAAEGVAAVNNLQGVISGLQNQAQSLTERMIAAYSVGTAQSDQVGVQLNAQLQNVNQQISADQAILTALESSTGTSATANVATQASTSQLVSSFLAAEGSLQQLQTQQTNLPAEIANATAAGNGGLATALTTQLQGIPAAITAQTTTLNEITAALQQGNPQLASALQTLITAENLPSWSSALQTAVGQLSQDVQAQTPDLAQIATDVQAVQSAIIQQSNSPATVTAIQALQAAINSGDNAAIAAATTALQGTITTTGSADAAAIAAAEKEVGDAIVAGNGAALTKGLSDLQTALATNATDQANAVVAAFPAGMKASADEISAAITGEQTTLQGLQSHQNDLQQELLIELAEGNGDVVKAIETQLQNVGTDIQNTQNTITQLQGITQTGAQNVVSGLSGVKASADQIAEAQTNATNAVNQLNAKLSDLQQQLEIAVAEGNGDLVKTIEAQIGTTNSDLSAANQTLSQIQTNTASASDLIANGITGTLASAGDTATAIANLNSTISGEQALYNDLNQQLIEALKAGNTDLANNLQSAMQTVNGYITQNQTLLKEISGNTGTTANNTGATANNTGATATNTTPPIVVAPNTSGTSASGTSGSGSVATGTGAGGNPISSDMALEAGASGMWDAAFQIAEISHTISDNQNEMALALQSGNQADYDQLSKENDTLSQQLTLLQNPPPDGTSQAIKDLMSQITEDTQSMMTAQLSGDNTLAKTFQDKIDQELSQLTGLQTAATDTANNTAAAMQGLNNIAGLAQQDLAAATTTQQKIGDLNALESADSQLQVLAITSGNDKQAAAYAASAVTVADQIRALQGNTATAFTTEIDSLKTQQQTLQADADAAMKAGNTTLANAYAQAAADLGVKIFALQGDLDAIAANTTGLIDAIAGSRGSGGDSQETVTPTTPGPPPVGGRTARDVTTLSPRAPTADAQQSYTALGSSTTGATSITAANDAAMQASANASTVLGQIVMGGLNTVAQNTAATTAAVVTIPPGFKATADQITGAIADEKATLAGLQQHQADLQQALAAAIANGDSTTAAAIVSQLSTVSSDIGTANSTLTELQGLQQTTSAAVITGMSGVVASADQIAAATKAAQDSVTSLSGQLKDLNQQLIVAEATGNTSLVTAIQTQIGQTNSDLSNANSLLGEIQSATGSTGVLVISGMSGIKASADQIASATKTAQDTAQNLSGQLKDLNQQLIVAESTGNTSLVNAIQTQIGQTNSDLSSANNLLGQIQSAAGISGAGIVTGMSGIVASASQTADAISNLQGNISNLQAQLKDLNQQLIVALGNGDTSLAATIETQIGTTNSELSTATGYLGQIQTNTSTAADLVAAGIQGVHASADDTRTAIANVTQSISDETSQAHDLQEQLIEAEASGNTKLAAEIVSAIQTVTGEIGANNTILQTLTGGTNSLLGQILQATTSGSATIATAISSGASGPKNDFPSMGVADTYVPQGSAGPYSYSGGITTVTGTGIASYDLGGFVGSDQVAQLHANEWVIPPSPSRISLPPDVYARINMPQMPNIPSGPSIPNVPMGPGSGGNMTINAPCTFNGVTNPQQMAQMFTQHLKTVIPGVGINRY